MNGATHRGKYTPGMENVKFIFPYTETNGTRTPVTVHQRFNDKDPLVIFSVLTQFSQGIFGGFSHNCFIGFTVDHDLPPSFVDVFTLIVLPDGQSPFFKKVNGRVNMPCYIGYQVIPCNPHQVVLHIFNIIFNSIGLLF